MDFSEAKAGLKWLCEDMMRRLSDEADPSEFGDIDGRVEEAAKVAAALGLPFPPIRQIHFDEGRGFIFVSSAFGGPRDSGFWHPSLGLQPDILGFWGYRVYDPAGGHKDFLLRCKDRQLDRHSKQRSKGRSYGPRSLDAYDPEEPLEGEYGRIAGIALDGMTGSTKEYVAKLLSRWIHHLDSMPSDSHEDVGVNAERGAERVKLRPCERKALGQWLQARKALGDCSDDEAYNWLVDHNDEESLPSLGSWKRYVRAGRKAHNRTKNSSRRGRTGGSASIVRREDI